MAHAAGLALGDDQSSGAVGNAINVTFVIHFDPLPAPGGRVLREGYKAERDNLRWLAELLHRIEREKGAEFVPQLHLQIAGDHAEYYLEDQEGFELLRGLYQKGIHTFGVHFHRNYKVGPHRWVSVPFQAPAGRRLARRITEDHIAEVDRLVARIIDSDEPEKIRRANHIITGHLLDQPLAAQMGFDLLTGGRNEALNLFFDHDVYNPYRPAVDWPLAEDPDSRWLLIPQSPVLGRIGEHAPIPPGVAEQYRQATRRGMIWQDLSIPAMRRKFLHLVLEWREHRRAGQQKVWVFGWHEHTNDLFPTEALRRKPSQRKTVAEFIEWLNTHFIGRQNADRRLIAQYANTDQVQEAYLRWEQTHPRESSFHYPARQRDWQQYPYQLKGLARELMYAHHEKQLTAFRQHGVHVHRLAKTEGRNWTIRDGQAIATGPTEEIYLLWSEKGEVTIDLSDLMAGKVRVIRGKSDTETVADASRITVPEEPIIVKRAKATQTAGDKDRVLIQFRMNCNYFQDEREAKRNCENLRWHLETFKKHGVKTSYWLTGLAAEQINRLDPELITQINEAGMPIAHHGANRPPNPQPIHRVRGENWQQDVQAILDYESYGLDPRTAKLDGNRIGGLKMIQQLFENRVSATGRFFEASILYAEKQLGCRAMIGLKDNTGAATNAAWFLGMKNMPDAFSVGPRQLLAAARGQFDVTGHIDRSIKGKTAQQAGSIAVLIHDTDFLRGPPHGTSDRKRCQLGQAGQRAISGPNERTAFISAAQHAGRCADQAAILDVQTTAVQSGSCSPGCPARGPSSEERRRARCVRCSAFLSGRPGRGPGPPCLRKSRNTVRPRRPWPRQTSGWVLETVLRPVGVKGFVVLPKRWVVERTFAWLSRCRRHSKDYERNPESSAAMIYISMIGLMSGRLANANT